MPRKNEMTLGGDAVEVDQAEGTGEYTLDGTFHPIDEAE